MVPAALHHSGTLRRFASAPMSTTAQHAQGNLRSIVNMMLAVMFFSLMDAVLKTLSAHYPPLQMACLIPGHYEAGMKGRIAVNVTEAASPAKPASAKPSGHYADGHKH